MNVSFIELDKLAQSATSEEKVRIYTDIALRAQKDEIFHNSIDFNVYWTSVNKYASLVKKGVSKKIVIIGYGSPIVAPWDPFSTKKGLPGSEECAVYASAELASRGYQVTLFMNPPQKSIWTSPFSNPRWCSIDMLNKDKTKYDIVIMWRRFDVDVGRKHGKTVFFWGHDTPFFAPNTIVPSFPSFDGLFVLSNHYYNQLKIFPNISRIPFTICGNGILLDHFKNATVDRANPHSIGYFSNYARGLILLLLIWPEIKKEFPKATLDICYGRQTWGTIPDEQLKFIISKIEEYKPLGVTERGKIGHLELANVMQQTSILAYPCPHIGIQETFCITVVKCQAAGCIPVTTRVGALNETVSPDAPCIPLINTNDDVITYKNLLINTMHRVENDDPEKIKKERQSYMNYATKFTWANCVDTWLELYNKVK